MSQLKVLIEKRNNIVGTAQALLRKTDITPEDRRAFDRMMAEADSVKADIDAIKMKEQRDAELPVVGGGYDKYGARYETIPEREYRMAFTKYLRSGDDRAIVEKRDQAAGTQSITYSSGATGGFFVPAGFVYDVDVALKYYAPLMDGSVCRILETATGSVLPYPTSNDTAQQATILSENNPVSEVDLSLGSISFGAYKFASGVVRVSLELLQDSAFDFESFLKQQFAIRFGRAYENYATVGTGSGQPTGILTAAVNSNCPIVTASGSSSNDGSSNTGANSIGTNDLVDLEHAIDPLYRRGAKWMLNDDTVRQVKTLLDKYGRPIWLPGLSVNAPDTILGYPYVVNQSMPKIAASAKTVVFGDLSKYVIRKVREMSVLRLSECYADYGQVGFLGFSRMDSNLVDAGTHPVALLEMHS